MIVDSYKEYLTDSISILIDKMKELESEMYDSEQQDKIEKENYAVFKLDTNKQ